MNIKEFLRACSPFDHRFARLDSFDPDRMDYTAQIETPDGRTINLRNPSEADDGTLSDKGHNVRPGSKLLAFGTANWDWKSKKQLTVGIDIDTNDNHAQGLTSTQV